VAGARGEITNRDAPRELARSARETLEGWMLSSPRAARGTPGRLSVMQHPGRAENVKSKQLLTLGGWRKSRPRWVG